jgi:hypothetical protein
MAAVARMSEATSGKKQCGFIAAPGFRCAHPGYEGKKEKEGCGTP